MILKAVIKYKLLEWAADAFLNGFSKLISKPLKKIFLKDLIEGKNYKSIVSKYEAYHNIFIEEKNEKSVVIGYTYHEDFEDNIITAWAYKSNEFMFKEFLPLSSYNIYMGYPNETDIIQYYYGSSKFVELTVSKDIFFKYYSKIEPFIIYGFCKYYLTGEHDYWNIIE